MTPEEINQKNAAFWKEHQERFNKYLETPPNPLIDPDGAAWFEQQWENMRKPIEFMVAEQRMVLDPEAIRAVAKARSSHEEAAKALLIAADYIQKGQPLPSFLRGWLAGSIKSAMENPLLYDPHNGDKGNALLVALHLKANNRRPADYSEYEVYCYMAGLTESKVVEGRLVKAISQNKAAKLAAKKFGFSASKAHDIYREQKIQNEI